MRATWGEKPGKDFMNTLESEEVGKYGRVGGWGCGGMGGWECESGGVGK
jgi:hypothetical protein